MQAVFMTFIELIVVVTYVRNLKKGKHIIATRKKACNAGIKRKNGYVIKTKTN